MEFLKRLKEFDRQRLRHYAGISRMPFLLLPVALVAVGTGASAWETGSVHLLRAFFALLGLLFLHIGVNAINEASDAKRGIDSPRPATPFSGGSGTVPSGRLSVREAYRFGIAMTAAGGLIGIGFIFVVGWKMIPLILAAVVLVAGYTDLFARIGLGEAAAGLGLGLLPVIGSALVQTGTVPGAAVAAGVISFILTFELLLLNEFPDQEADRKGGRKNLVLMLGPRRAARVWFWTALMLPVFILHFAAVGLLPWTSISVLFSLGLLWPAFEWIETPGDRFPSPTYGLLKANVAWNLAAHFLLAASFFAAMLL